MFELTISEWDALRSQKVMFKNGKGNFPKYLPYAFAELPDSERPEAGAAGWKE